MFGFVVFDYYNPGVSKAGVWAASITPHDWQMHLEITSFRVFSSLSWGPFFPLHDYHHKPGSMFAQE